MTTFKRMIGAFLVGLLGCGVGLGLWRLYDDYRDFNAMRVWVAQMQRYQAEAAAKQTPQAPAPAPDAKQ